MDVPTVPGYWLYEDWTTTAHRATLHRGDCPWRQHGHGLAGGTQPEDVRWHGPFTLSKAAQPFVGRGGVSLTPLPCKHCLPVTTP